MSDLGPVVQTLRYFAAPRTIVRFDIDDLVLQARKAAAVIVMACGVGDTLVENTLLLQVHGAKTALPESDLMRTIHCGFERTSEGDPKYPIRLLVDIAIKALSPAINDPTTAVQAIDQIEDLLRRLGGRDLDAGYADGVLRLIFPMPTEVPTAKVTGSLGHLVGDGERSPYPLLTDSNQRSSICIAATVSSSHLR